MATAKDLGLRKDDVVRMGTRVYTDVYVPVARSWGLEGDLDMRRGARVRIVRVYESGCVDVEYLENEPAIEKRRGRSYEISGLPAGAVSSVWDGYVGFIPGSVEPAPRTA